MLIILSKVCGSFTETTIKIVTLIGYYFVGLDSRGSLKNNISAKDALEKEDP